MASEVYINPEEGNAQHHNNEDKALHMRKMMNQLVSTCQCSTQVNMIQENMQFQNCVDRKKMKKKQYRLKKKLKEKEQQQNAKIRLTEIIHQIYERTTNYENSKVEIKQSLTHLAKGQKFHMFLNDTIKMHVKNMQRDIWDFMQSIIKQNSLQRNSDDQDFYLQMIEHIYQQFCFLKSSSQEIQYIINTYMSLNSNQNMNEPHGLDISTFKFMIESDQTIKNLLKICHRRIFSKHTQHVQQIQELMRMISRNDEDQQQQHQLEVTQTSTSVDQEEQEKLTKKKKRRKLKESDFKMNFQDIIKRLNEMEIDEDKRTGCQASEQWAKSMKKKYLSSQKQKQGCNVSESWTLGLASKYKQC